LDWDGGKIGGTPSWLNPRDLPNQNTPFRCTVCASRNNNNNNNNNNNDNTNTKNDIDESTTPSPLQRSNDETNVSGTDKQDTEDETNGTILRFVAQIYSPADKATGNQDAFHRSLYVFCCPHPLCSSPPSERGDMDMDTGGGIGSVLVLRGQLQRKNDFYPFDCGEEDGVVLDGVTTGAAGAAGGGGKDVADNATRTCAICGQRATGRCPKLERWFCGREHQRDYHRLLLRARKGNGIEDGDGAAEDGVEDEIDVAPCRYRETELVVEEEPRETADEDGDHAQQPTLETLDAASLFPTTGTPNADDDGDDGELEQDDLNEMTGLHGNGGGTVDPLTVEFYTRVGRAGGDVKGQCLRYSRWPAQEEGDEEGEDGPLWIGSCGRPKSGGVPPCGYCGAERRFEFQLMPQMIHFLVGKASKDSKDGTDSTDARGSGDQRREALLAASDVVRRVQQEGGAEALPEGFQDRQQELVEEFRDRLFDDDSGGGGAMDWGTVAVYTCTASCGAGGGSKEEDGMGAYRKEFAWRQPPLDTGRN